jgi:hypothetical protein
VVSEGITGGWTSKGFSIINYKRKPIEPATLASTSAHNMSKRTSFNTQDEPRKSNVHGDLLLCGELKKKSSVPPKRYQTRYFEAIGHYLNYYQDESKSTLKGALDMDDCVACELDGLKVVLVMNISDGHRVKLKAENASYAEHWYEGLNVLTKEQDGDEDSDPDED